MSVNAPSELVARDIAGFGRPIVFVVFELNSPSGQPEQKEKYRHILQDRERIQIWKKQSMSNSSVGTLYSLSLESSNQAGMRVGNHVTLVSCSYNQILCSVASNIAILAIPKLMNGLGTSVKKCLN